jgi:hypothetical protein
MLGQRQSLFNILDREENCSAFRKFSRSLDRDFTRVANPFPMVANHVATTPTTVANKDRVCRNCIATEQNDVQHLSLFRE